ncbi:CDGSH iron-sulfur domain-containing protein [soil metagenome]
MSKTIIKINNNGSVKVEGDFEIIDSTGAVFNINGRTAVSLCRCGLSKNQPFCDSSHKGVFQSEITAFELPIPKPKV